MTLKGSNVYRKYMQITPDAEGIACFFGLITDS